MKSQQFTFGLFLLLGAVLVAVLVAACTKGDDEDQQKVAVRPPVILEEETMQRLIGALHALQDLSRGLPAVQQQARDQDAPAVLPMGLSVTAFLGEAAVPIVQRYGFANTQEFESYLGHAQHALLAIQWAELNLFDGKDKLYSLNLAIAEKEALLQEIERDGSLSASDRNLQAAATRNDLDRLLAERDDVEETSDAMRDHYKSVPQANIEMVRKHRSELQSLIPSGQPRPDMNPR